MNKKIFIYGVLTCNRRKLDSWKLYQYFSKNNYEMVSNPNDANIILLNTCAYSNKHSETSLQMTKKFLKFKAELIVIGCLPEIEKEELSKIFNGKTISTKSLKNIDEIFPENKIKFCQIEDANIPLENSNEYLYISSIKNFLEKSSTIKKLIDNIFDKFQKNIMRNDLVDCHRNIIKYSYFKYFKERLQPTLSVHKDSYFIRPSWGCYGNCTYCVIKKAIGPLKSKPIEEIISEFKKGLNIGFKNFIFDADDLGAYGMDIGINFSKMLDDITEISGNYSVHLRYIHPVWIVKYCDNFEKVLKKEKIKSLGSAIQSANPRILKLMNRYPDIVKIKKSFSAIKNAYPDLLIATECINRFPTESMDEFQETLDFIKEIKFDWGFIFPFSCKSGSEAKNIEPKISQEEIRKRMKYANEYFGKIGYKSSLFKKQGILVFSKDDPRIKLDKGTMSFCYSTLE